MAENKDKSTTVSTTSSAQNEALSSGENMIVDAKKILREGLVASLATTHFEYDTPYASLVTMATEPDSSPILLLSGLAIHTKNLQANPRGCLLIQSAGRPTDPLEGGRISVWGHFEETKSPRARARFLSRHPTAEAYADFSDFAFYKLHIDNAHYVGGFGRIRTITAEQLATDCSNCEELLELETGFLNHMNKDHLSAVQQYASNLLDGPEGNWRLTGLDPDGFDLVSGDDTLRYDFDARITTPDDMKKMLEKLANQAKGHHHDH